MQKEYLGEFEELVLTMVGILQEDSYGNAIVNEIKDRVGREVNLSAVHVTLYRLEDKGYVRHTVPKDGRKVLYSPIVSREQASHSALRRAADTVRPQLAGRWPLLVQGDVPRDLLLRRFREAGSAILLGTDSFWEGVDVPGRALRVLILAKLPFKVPSEPLTAARLERLAARGLDGFSHYLLPHAALKLKQGFGRLIRSRADVGAVVLLDRRVVTKPYGRTILAGLPSATKAIGNWDDVRRACEEFFAQHGIGVTV